MLQRAMQQRMDGGIRRYSDSDRPAGTPQRAMQHRAQKGGYPLQPRSSWPRGRALSELQADAATQADTAAAGLATLSTIAAQEQMEEANEHEDGPDVNAGTAPACASGDGGQELTTVMLQNLPEGYSREMVAELLKREGFTGLYDFIYLPADFARGVFFGYVFVNFVVAEAAQRCQSKLQGFMRWGAGAAASSTSDNRACRVSWGDTHQGLKAQVERYRNSPVMHPSVPDRFKPALYARDGSRVPFPPPTRRLRPPRIRRAKEVADSVDSGGLAGDNGESCDDSDLLAVGVGNAD
jgi:hypothetical protein